MIRGYRIEVVDHGERWSCRCVGRREKKIDVAVHTLSWTLGAGSFRRLQDPALRQTCEVLFCNDVLIVRYSHFSFFILELHSYL
jgi:hypothetical protein